jgi:hypothetical protein
MTRKRKSEPAKVEIVKPVQARHEPLLNEKDRDILKEMDKIIWNPSLLNKFKKEENPDGQQTAKKSLKKG